MLVLASVSSQPATVHNGLLMSAGGSDRILGEICAELKVVGGSGHPSIGASEAGLYLQTL